MVRKMKWVGIALGVTVCLQSVHAGDWPQFRGPDRDGKAAKGPALLKAWPEGGPRKLWSYEELGTGYASVSIANGRVYTTGLEGENGILYAFNLEGKLLGKVTYGRDWSKSYKGPRTTPTVHNGRLYLVTGFGEVVCLDAKRGKKLWTVDTKAKFGARNISWGISESPLVLDDKVIVTPGGAEVGVVALDPKNGNTLWVCKGINDTSGYCSPILIERGGRAIIAQLMGTSFVGIESGSGKLLWNVKRANTPAHKIQAVSPVYADGMFYVTTGYGGERGEMYKLSADGTQVTSQWRDSELDCQVGGVVLLDGYIYGAADRNNRGSWLCMKLASGEVASKIKGVGKGSAIYADGMLYGVGEKGEAGLFMPDPKNFQMVSSFRLPAGGDGPFRAHPAIADGRLYIRHDTRLFVYDISQ
jgi:outer membrane protein assembly factor BamB